MTKTMRIWSGLGLAAMASAATAQAANIADPVPGPHAGRPVYVQLADNAGEGEGGGAQAEMDDAAYLTQLALMQGHLLVGTALYAQGAQDAAAVHMKHPKHELYAGLVEALEERKVAGFADELEALAVAVEQRKPAADVDAAHAKVDAAIDKALAAGKVDPETVLKAVVQIVRTAADEYGEGVSGGKVVNPKEYQDAYGFVQVARAMTARARETAAEQQKAVFDSVLTELDALKPAWPDIKGEQPVSTEAKTIAVAAAKLELLSYDLK
jgi:hypothetical protein